MPTARHDKSEDKRQTMPNSAKAAHDRDESSEDDENKSSSASNSHTASESGNRSRNGGGRASSKGDGRSFGSMISQSLAEESQQGVDRVLSELRQNIEIAKDYVSENPREAAGLAICAGAVAWALLGTKPGRRVFEAGAAIAVPYATKWVARNMADALR